MPQSLQHLSKLFAEFAKIEAFSRVLSLSIFSFVVALGYLVRRALFSRLQVWAQHKNSRVDSVLIASAYRPWMLWAMMLGIYAATEISDVPDLLSKASDRALLTLWIISVTWVFARVAGRMVRLYGSGPDGSRTIGTLSQVLASLVVVTLGTLTLLNTYGIAIRPALAALGVGGLAVALALQDTLSNFFAGFYVSLGGQIRVGDFIQLEGGPKGYVADVGWRTTTLRELTNNLVVIPNNKVAQTIITNYHLPEPRTTLLIPVSLNYDSDPDHVERVLIDVVKQAAGELQGILLEPAPRARLLGGFGDSPLQFTLAVQVTGYERLLDLQDELRKRILRRFKQEAISMSAPVRAVEFRPSPGLHAAEEPVSRPPVDDPPGSTK